MPEPDTTSPAVAAAASAGLPPAARRSWLLTGLKIVVTIGLLVFVVWRVDVRLVLAAFSAVSPGPLAAAFAWVAVAIVISAFKWGRILKRRGIEAGLGDLTRLYYIASFFNAVLPTGIGGDPVRAWLLGREKNAMSEAFASVIAERLIASAALGLSSAIALPLVGFTPKLAALVGLFIVIDAVLIGLFLVPSIGEKAVRAVIPARFPDAASATRDALVAVRQTLTDWPLVFEVLGWSIAFQACVAMVNASLFWAIGEQVSIGMALVYSPMISTVSMLPISLSGLGVPQAAYAYFFGLSGVPMAASVAVSLGFFLVIAISTLPGAVLFLFAKNKGETDGL